MNIKDYITTYKSDRWFVAERDRDGCRRPVIRIVKNGKVYYVFPGRKE